MRSHDEIVAGLDRLFGSDRYRVLWVQGLPNLPYITRIRFAVVKGIKYSELALLADVLGTEHINVAVEDGYVYVEAWA